MLWSTAYNQLYLEAKQHLFLLLFVRQTTYSFMVICETQNNFYFLLLFVSQTTFIFMVLLDPNNLYLAAKQPSREPNLELACDSSRQISSLLHCSCSQAVFSLIMCDPNTLHVCCDLGAKQLLCYCYFGAKQLLCLWLFGRQTISIFIVMCGIKQLQGLRLFVSQTTFMFMVIWEPNNLNLEAKQPSREPQVEPSCASSRQISSLLHGSWSQASQTTSTFLWLFWSPTHLYFMVIWS